MYSQCLAMDTSLYVLLPETKQGNVRQSGPDRRYPVVYVLHGYSDNKSSWMRKSILEYVARAYDVIVVMPEVNNSFYANRPGARYYDYLTDELPARVAQFFPASTRREDTFIMGNSMGGYGAFMLAINNPQQYAAAVSFSGILGLAPEERCFLFGIPDFRSNWEMSFTSAQAFHTSHYDLFAAAKRLDERKIPAPRLYHFCGTADFLAYEMGKKWIDYARENTALPVRYEEVENGGHDWTTWNPYIEKAFDFFGLHKRPAIYAPTF